MKRHQKGFTFLELLIAVTLFSVGMISVLQIFPVNRRLLAQSTQASQAVYLAQEQVEYIRTLDYPTLTTGTFEAKAYLSTTGSAAFGQYQRDTVVSLIDSNRASTVTDVGLKKVVVTIYWSEHSVNRQYSVTTYVANI
jgi:prepilin-type N-terminal cleavage/methylation domain-containing protein